MKVQIPAIHSGMNCNVLTNENIRWIKKYFIGSLESSETASQDISYTVSTVEADSTSLSTNPFSSHTDTDLSEGIYLHLSKFVFYIKYL